MTMAGRQGSLLLAAVSTFLTSTPPNSPLVDYNQRWPYICLIMCLGITMGGLIVGSALLYGIAFSSGIWFQNVNISLGPMRSSPMLTTTCASTSRRSSTLAPVSVAHFYCSPTLSYLSVWPRHFLPLVSHCLSIESVSPDLIIHVQVYSWHAGNPKTKSCESVAPAWWPRPDRCYFYSSGHKFPLSP